MMPSVGLPSTLVAVAVLLRIKCKDGKVAHLAIGRLDSEIWHSRLLRAVRAVVTHTTSPPLLRRVEIKRVFTHGAVNHRRHLSSYPCNVARETGSVKSRIVIVDGNDVLPDVRISLQLLSAIVYHARALPILAKIDEMIKRSNFGITLKMSVTKVNIKTVMPDSDVCFPVRPNLIKFSDLKF
jgi:hypothetical protein